MRATANAPRHDIAEPYVQQPQAQQPIVPRQGQTFLTHDHEMICLVYEESLKRGFEADYGSCEEGGYFIEIYGCKLDDLSKILAGAEVQRQAIGEQLSLWDKREAQERREAA